MGVDLGVLSVIRYVDVCSGYSAFSQAVVGLDFECAGYAEIEPFPCALLGHHYGASRPRYMPDPDGADLALFSDDEAAKERAKRIALRKAVASMHDSHFGNAIVNFGDFTQIREDDVGPVDLLIGGTPCQGFSIAGQRLGLDDPRGNLTLEFLALAKRLRVPWVAWENVPGFLSHDGGRTMGTFLRLMGQLGHGFAYRVLDAQFIRVDGCERAVPQRRNRLFVVGHIGDTAGPATVLFERESLLGHPAPRRETGQGTTHAVAPSLVSSGRGVERAGDTRGQDAVIGELTAFGGNNTTGPIDTATARSAHGGPHGGPHGRLDFESETFVVGALTPGGHPGGHPGGYNGQDAHTGHLIPVAHAFDACQTDVIQYGDISGPLDTNGYTMGVAHSLRADGFDASEDGSGRGTPLVPVAYSIMPQNSCKDYKAREVDVAQPLMAGGPVGGNQGADFIAQPEPLGFLGNASGSGHISDKVGLAPTLLNGKGGGSTIPAIAFQERGREGGRNVEWQENLAYSMNSPSGGGRTQELNIVANWQVRRLTPTECERLMGVSDDFTAIQFRGKLAADGPKYKALGNSQCRNVMRWIAIGLRDVIRAQAEMEIET